jgi:L-threonylcarbamoyladenylate synthase
VVYPTDTAYGLAVDATNFSAVKKLYRLKGRDFNRPVHVIFPDTAWMRRVVEIGVPALKLMNHFLPGPLTIVLPLRARGRSWELLSAKTKSLGVRLPKHPVVFELLKQLKKPITATSANLSGDKTPYSVNEVLASFKKSNKKADFYLDGGRLKKIKPSTVVLVNGNHATILREGPISRKQIATALK